MAATRLVWLAILITSNALLAADTGSSGPLADTPARNYRIVAGESWLRVLVFRGGLLRGLGHNHVVSSTGFDGIVTVTEPFHDSDVSIELPLATLTVDDPGARTAEGDQFPGTVPDEDIAATRKNMLSPRLLDAARFPVIALRSTSIAGELDDLSISFDVEILGTVRTLTVPAHAEISGDTLRANGEFDVTHAALGLRPFTAALGALRVRNGLVLRYSIVARRTSGGG